MTQTFWESDQPESQDEFWADDVDEEFGPLPQNNSGNLNQNAETVQQNSTDAIKSPGENQSLDTKPEALIELRSRESVLRALRKCLGA